MLLMVAIFCTKSASRNISDVLTLFLNVTSLGVCMSVVFDGFDSGPSIKDQEHSRSLKAGQVVPERQINRDIKNIGNQEAFLFNVNNKKALIALLSDYLQKHGITVHYAKGDVDTLIVSVAVQMALSENLGPVGVVVEDTDLLALLLFHGKHDMKDIFFISDPKKG